MALAQLDVDEAIWARLTAPDVAEPSAAEAAVRAARRARRRQRREALGATAAASADAAGASLPAPGGGAPLQRAVSLPEFWEAQPPSPGKPSAAPSPPAAVTTDVWQQRLANLAFLLLGVGVSVAWTALRSGLVYYCNHFSLGSAFYTVLTVAYNVPALPVLVLQIMADDRVDARVGKARALTCRFATTLLAMAGGCLLVAVVRTQALVLAVTVMTGVMNAAAFGTSLQYFSLFPPQCGGYYFMGASLSSLATIGLTFASGFQRDDPSEAIFATFYSGAGVFVLAGLAAVLVLMYSPIGMHYMAVGEARAAAAHAARAARRMQMRKLSAAAALEPAPHAAGGGGEAGVPLLGAAADDVSGDTLAVPLAPPLHRGAGSFDADADTDADGDDGVGGDSGEHAAAAAASSPMAILRSTAACHVALGLCWACTTAVDGLLDVVPTSQSSASGQRTFRLLLLYASLLGELSGKQLNVVRVGGWGVAKTPTTLLVAVAVRALAALAALLYVMQPRLTASGGYALRVDGLAVAFQAFFDCTGAYLSSVAYTIASKQLAAPSLRARSAVMLGFTVTVGVYAGLGVAYAVASIARAFTS